MDFDADDGNDDFMINGDGGEAGGAWDHHQGLESNASI